MVGVVVVTVDLEVPPPQASESRMQDPAAAARKAVNTRGAAWAAADTLIILQTSACRGHQAGSSGGKPFRHENNVSAQGAETLLLFTLERGRSHEQYPNYRKLRDANPDVQRFQ